MNTTGVVFLFFALASHAQNSFKLKYHPKKAWYFRGINTTKVGTESGLNHQQNANNLSRRACKYHRYLCDVTSPRGFSVFFISRPVKNSTIQPWSPSPLLFLYHKPTIAPATTTNSRRCGRPRSRDAETVAFASDAFVRSTRAPLAGPSIDTNKSLREGGNGGNVEADIIASYELRDCEMY